MYVSMSKQINKIKELKSTEILVCLYLRELIFFHTIAPYSVHKSKVRVHDINLVVKSRKYLIDFISISLYTLAK